MMRLQSAIEFLTTYGWAILIISVVLASLYSLGVFNQNALTPNICALPADIGCLSSSIAPTGILTINIQQATEYTINVFAVGCNDKGSPTANTITGGAGTMTVISPPATIPVGGNATFSIPCYTYSKATSNEIVYNGIIGSAYKGYLIVNYTNLPDGFNHTAEGTLIQKVT
jgi:hypothetical protein